MWCFLCALMEIVFGSILLDFDEFTMTHDGFDVFLVLKNQKLNSCFPSFQVPKAQAQPDLKN